MADMNTSNETQNLIESLDSAVFCGLVDAGVDPGTAWDFVESDYDLDAEVLGEASA